MLEQREHPHTVRTVNGDQNGDGLPEFVGVSVPSCEALR